MPRVKVAVWNIQNFGATGAVHDRYKGANSVEQVKFIAKVVRGYEIDVLMILEVFPRAGASLDNLLAALNRGLRRRDWCYDWIKGAVDRSAAVVPEVNVRRPNHLSWRGSRHAPRQEGYALFWRDNQQGRFTMLDGELPLSNGSRAGAAYARVPPANPLNLSLRGRQYRLIGNLPYVEARSGFDAAAPAASMDWSDYPDISKYGNPRVPNWERSRRPAYAVIDLAGGMGQVPIVGFHAPSTGGLASMAIYLSGLARELYAVPTAAGLRTSAKALAGGDYNVNTDAPGRWASDYVTYVDPIARRADSGAGMTPFNDDLHIVRTSVFLRQYRRGKPIGPPIQSRDLADYRRGTLDNIFERALVNGTGYVLPLPRHVMRNGWLAGRTLRGWYAYLLTVEAAVGNIDAARGPRLRTRRRGVWRLVPVFPSMTDYDAFRRGLQNGGFDGDPATGIGLEARECAIFIHDFISDHFPMVMEFRTR